MAYQNTPVSDGLGVVQAIASFADDNGWTVHRDEGDGTEHIVTLSAGGAYITLRGVPDSVFLNGHRELDADSPWNEQPDQYYIGNYHSHTEVKFRVNPLRSVHLFASATPEPYVYAAVEKEPGYYRHIVIGHMQKFGTALGGLFWDVSDTDWDRSHSGRLSYIRYPLVCKEDSDFPKERKGGLDCQDLDGNARWASFYYYSGYTKCGMWANEITRHIGDLSAIDFNGRTPLQTPFIEVDTDGVYVPYGTPPNFRYVSMEFFEAGDEMTIGPDTWKVFPVIRRAPAIGYQTPAPEPSEEGSENYGIAYLKD